MTSSPPSTPNEISGDLPLRALGYWMGDLSAEQAALFEQQLAADQAARDALADIVQLHAGILRSGENSSENSTVARDFPGKTPGGSPATQQKSFCRFMPRGTITAAVVVATVLLAWGIRQPWSTTQSPTSLHSTQSHPTLLSVAELNSWSSLPVLEMSWPLDEDSLDLSATELEVSDWMMAAVNAEDRHSDSDAGEETL
jgi:hypothetical protein